MLRRNFLAASLQISFPNKPARKAAPKAEIAGVDKVWDRGGHNAFTDLVLFRGRWFLAFREATTHVSADGAIRILSSIDGDRWEPSALLTYPVADLRDPKLVVTPDQRLMLTTAGAMHPPSDTKHKSFVCLATVPRASALTLTCTPDVGLSIRR